jgi:hypothetical protein
MLIPFFFVGYSTDQDVNGYTLEMPGKQTFHFPNARGTKGLQPGLQTYNEMNQNRPYVEHFCYQVNLKVARIM